jgi:hypothetical protein
LQDAQKTAIREKLLEALGFDNSANIKNKVSDAVAEIARQYVDEGMTILRISGNSQIRALTVFARSTMA